MNDSFEDINFNLSGKIIFLDVDGTLAPDKMLDFSEKVLGQLDKLKSGNKVFLCTNSNDKIRKSKIEELLRLPVVTHKYKKPNSKILSELGLKRADGNLLVIGDKFLTDGLFARNIGAEFRKVGRKISGRESLAIKLINFFDDISWRIAKLLKLI